MREWQAIGFCFVLFFVLCCVLWPSLPIQIYISIVLVFIAPYVQSIQVLFPFVSLGILEIVSLGFIGVARKTGNCSPSNQNFNSCGTKATRKKRKEKKNKEWNKRKQKTRRRKTNVNELKRQYWELARRKTCQNRIELQASCSISSRQSLLTWAQCAKKEIRFWCNKRTHSQLTTCRSKRTSEWLCVPLVLAPLIFAVCWTAIVCWMRHMHRTKTNLNFQNFPSLTLFLFLSASHPFFDWSACVYNRTR